MANGAIAESGAGRSLDLLSAAEQVGVKPAGLSNRSGIRELRAMPADTLLKLANRLPFGSFCPCKDGYVLPDDVKATPRSANLPQLRHISAGVAR